MRRTFIVVTALAALAAGPALARQDHAEHHPDQAAPAPTHEMCKSVMGKQMDGKPGHDHGRDETGAPTWPNGKPVSAAEMEKMHKTCAEMMKKSDSTPDKK
ncbi:hypothetical protein ASD89_19640 [Caulobacter sp. Root656]|nr:hypothetical protein ASD89_19640 [Caulobacter sp. Root656]